jgi:predicted regulator of Ras-like GTPase activity (Roadblock/LC7/MglB family)
MARDDEVLELLREISGVEGVRGAMIANPEGALGNGLHSGLQPAAANDVAKTVRRMVVASTTATAPLRELLINFGPSRMMVRPLHEDAILVALIERDTDTKVIRGLLDKLLLRMQRALDGETVAAAPEGDETDQEISQLMASGLGPVLREIESTYHRYRQRRGQSPEDTRQGMHEQMREWLLCCNPSTYTLPLLLDGLSETMSDDAVGRNGFVNEAQELLRRAGAIR